MNELQQATASHSIRLRVARVASADQLKGGADQMPEGRSLREPRGFGRACAPGELLIPTFTWAGAGGQCGRRGTPKPGARLVRRRVAPWVTAGRGGHALSRARAAQRDPCRVPAPRGAADEAAPSGQRRRGAGPGGRSCGSGGRRGHGGRGGWAGCAGAAVRPVRSAPAAGGGTG